MFNTVNNFIPIASSEAGLCLTADNWHQSKSTALSYSLEFLLHKPGLELLRKITDLPRYLGWSGQVVLNAQALTATREGIYILKSPYDGSKIQITVSELIELIQHLKPDAVILPQNILKNCPTLWGRWSDSITPFIYVDDLHNAQVPCAHGVYFNYTNESVLNQLDHWSHLPIYALGTFDAESMQRVRARGIKFIESDEPANKALNGTVYSKSGVVDLTQSSSSMIFEPIDPECVCPTCSQQLTQAYLNHLLHHTPLLAQRFLIQHNVYWMAF